MIKKIHIATQNEQLFKMFSDISDNISLEIHLSSEDEFIKNPCIDILHYYVISTEIFGGIPKLHESIILDTNKKNQLPSFIVISPIFKSEKEFSIDKMISFQVCIPLKKAIEFSKENDRITNYGMHTNIMARNSEDLINNFETLKLDLLKILKDNDISG